MTEYVTGLFINIFKIWSIVRVFWKESQNVKTNLPNTDEIFTDFKDIDN